VDDLIRALAGRLKAAFAAHAALGAEADLARLPGVGAVAARALVQARPFRGWDEVDAVRGVGPARLRLLQQATELDP